MEDTARCYFLSFEEGSRVNEPVNSGVAKELEKSLQQTLHSSSQMEVLRHSDFM